MPILKIVIILVVVGFLLWLVETKIPMDPWIKWALNVFVLVMVAIWLLQLFGLWDWLMSARV